MFQADQHAVQLAADIQQPRPAADQIAHGRGGGIEVAAYLQIGTRENQIAQRTVAIIEGDIRAGGVIEEPPQQPAQAQRKRGGQLGEPAFQRLFQK